MVAHLNLRRRLDLGDDLLGLLNGPAGYIQLGLGDIVYGAQTERSQCSLCSSVSERRDHHYGHRVAPHQLLQKGESIHPRHFDIQGEDIWVKLLDLFPRSVRIACRADDFEHRIGIDDSGQQLAHQGRIINDQNAIGGVHNPQESGIGAIRPSPLVLSAGASFPTTPLRDPGDYSCRRPRNCRRYASVR